MTKYSGYGAEFTLAGALVVQCTNISGPSMSLDTEDVTTHDSTSAWEEVVATILRSGEVTLDLVFDPAGATHVALWTTMVSRAAAACTIIFPNHATHTTWSFNAFVTGFETSQPVDGALTATATLKPTGVITLA
jgi:predicted secreted protein